MNSQTHSFGSEKDCKPINRNNLSVAKCLDTQIISDDSETEVNFNLNFQNNFIMKPNTLQDIIQLTKSIGLPPNTINTEDCTLNQRFKKIKDIKSSDFLEIIEVDSISSETNQSEILIVPPPVPLDSILIQTNSEKTSDFVTSNPSSNRKLKYDLPSASRSPAIRPMLKNTTGNMEKYLANLERRFKKLSSEDKVLNWNFSNEVDDVEDFLEFENNRQMIKMKNSNNEKYRKLQKKLAISTSSLKNLKIRPSIVKKKRIELLKSTKNSFNKFCKAQKQHKGSGHNKSNLIINRLNAKDITLVNSDTFKIPNVPRKYLLCKPCQNTEKGCGRTDCEFLKEDHKEEFYKYLGLSTKSKNGETLLPLIEQSDLKRRSLRVRQLQCQARVITKHNINQKNRKIESSIDEKKNLKVFAVTPERMRNSSIFFQSNAKSEKKNAGIRIIRPHNLNSIAINLQKSAPNKSTIPIKVLPEDTKVKSKIKILCSYNNNPIPINSIHNQNSVVQQTILNELRNTESPFSINSKISSQKVSNGNSSCHADDENSSQNNNTTNSGRKKDSLIIVKNSYEQKLTHKINIISSSPKAIDCESKLSIHKQDSYLTNNCTNDDKEKDVIKIIEKVTYPPKIMKYENFLPNHECLKVKKPNTNLSPKVLEKECKNVKEKIKIEFSANYDNKISKYDLNSSDLIKKSNIQSHTNMPVKDVKSNKNSNTATSEKPKIIKDINRKLLVLPIQKKQLTSKSVQDSKKKIKNLIKNPSRLKFFRLVLKNPKQKEKFTKKIETKIRIKRDRRQKLAAKDKSKNLINTEKKKEEDKCTNEHLKSLPKSIVTISSKDIYENLKLNLIPNPLKFEDGDVLHAYYEKEYLIIVQQNTISFWKYSKILQMLGQKQEWQLLGESKRNTTDDEIISPFKNRLLIDENIPIYIELRARQLPYSSRECNLLSPYICAHYYSEVDNRVQHNSIQLDTIKSLSSNVLYTTITNTRYFVISWKQDTVNNSTRTGLCKYALAPDLDTLASIREFKNLRHIIFSLDCINSERLVAFGETQITIWDIHTGDILSNLDLNIPIGRNLSAILYTLESENYMLLYQLIHSEDENTDVEILPQLKILALNISNNIPSYRLIYNHKLPMQFENIKSSLNLYNYIIVTSLTGEELWMFVQQPQRLLFMNDDISTSLKRFYTTGNENYVEITGDYLNVKLIHENLMNFITT